MLKIKNVLFEEKFTEINFRQRMYKGKSYITLVGNTEFYPELVDGSMICGGIEIKLDMDNVSSIDDFLGRAFDGDIGKVTISVNNDGVWEHKSCDNFKMKIGKRNGRKLNFILEVEDCVMETEGTMVSLYTTSTSSEELADKFDLRDFYDKAVTREIGNSKVVKYYIK